MTNVSMDWLLDSLRLMREVHDWAVARKRRDPAAQNTNQVLKKATRELEALVQASGLSTLDAPPIRPVPSDSQLVEPLGPDQGSLGPYYDRINGHNPNLVAGDSEYFEPNDVADTFAQKIRIEDIDPQAILAIKRLRRYGYKGYLVGGCVRDLLLGITPKDFDIVTDARPEEVKSVFRNSRIIGRRFRLVHLYYRGGKVLEVATFRASIPNDEDEDSGNSDLLIRRDNVFGTEQEDAQRRDFTINALFYDPESNRIIDHVGGLDDINVHLVRMIGDPNIRLREDPVRIIRAIRFRAKAGLIIEDDLARSLSRYVDELTRCPPARLLEETLKLLRMGHARASFEEMLEHGVLEVLLPEVKAFIEGRFGLLAGSSVMETRNPVEEIRAHLNALDEVVNRAPVPDEVVLGALLFPMADAMMCHADVHGRDRNRNLAELLSQIGVRIQITRKLSEQLRQSYNAQRHFMMDTNGSRRRRRMSPSSFVQKPFFPAALRLFEIHQRALNAPLKEVATWEAKAAEEGLRVDGNISNSAQNDNFGSDHRPRSPRRRRRRHQNRRRK